VKLTVFGSTGRTGRQVVEQAMARGHQVVAFTRRPAALEDCAGPASGLDWTIARLNRLTSKPTAGQARISPGLFAQPTAITRADADRAVLDITEDQGPGRDRGQHRGAKAERSLMRHTRIFDAGQGYGPITDLVTFTDASVVRRADQWWMFAGGIDKVSGEIQLLTATLPVGSPLSATGWQITRDPGHPHRPVILAGKDSSHPWDGRGGRHCPAYARGYDPDTGRWVERIYYAGAAQSYLGPYSIGYVEWDGTRWSDQAEPVFTADQDWEYGSVYEPNVLYHDGLWKMWYVAGANQDDYLVQGYAQSRDGSTGWSARSIFAPDEEKIFDFCVRETAQGYEALFSRVNVAGRDDLPLTGLWWCQASTPARTLSDWSDPVRITGPGPWKPCLQYAEPGSEEMFVFCDDAYPNTSGHGIPVHFTIDCLETSRPADTK